VCRLSLSLALSFLLQSPLNFNSHSFLFSQTPVQQCTAELYVRCVPYNITSCKRVALDVVVVASSKLKRRNAKNDLI
jgi:hypothetical protein